MAPPKPSFLHTLYATMFVHQALCNFYRDWIVIVNALRPRHGTPDGQPAPLTPIAAPEDEFAQAVATAKIAAFQDDMGKETNKYTKLESWRRSNETKLRREIDEHAAELETKMENQGEHPLLQFHIGDPDHAHHVRVIVGQHDHDYDFQSTAEAADFQYAVCGEE